MSLAVTPEIATEINRLHGEICDSVRTNLPKAIRIGELLASIKAGLPHGEWLPWLRDNVQFTDRTARNYVRCFENRERLKLETVSDLTGAYRLIAPPKAPDKAALIRGALMLLIEVKGEIRGSEKTNTEERLIALQKLRKTADLALNSDLGCEFFSELLAILNLCGEIELEITR